MTYRYKKMRKNIIKKQAKLYLLIAASCVFLFWHYGVT